MPVLDARALELDPEGMAFLIGVLRQTRAPRLPTRNVPGVGRVRFRMTSRLRVANHPKELFLRTARQAL